MRALLRTVTGSPRTSPGKGKGKELRYSVSDVAKAWNSITATFAANKDGNPASKNGSEQLTILSRSIDILIEALASEATAYAMDESTGPCLEYMLTNDILSTLVEESLSDKPTGVLGSVIKAFDTLVVLLGDEFIALASRSLSKLLKGCFQPPASVNATGSGQHSKDGSADSADMERLPSTNYRSELYSPQLASLLCGVCSRIKAHPDLLPIFFSHKRPPADRKKPNAQVNSGPSAVRTLEVLKSPTPSHRSLSTASSKDATSESPSASALGESSTTSLGVPAEEGVNGPSRSVQQHDLPILTYLLKYIHRDGRTGEFARAGILFLVDLGMSTSNGGTAEVASKASKADRRRTMLASARRPSLQSRKSSHSTNGDTVPLQATLARYIADSDLAEMIGAGIGALYGLLPSKVHVPALSPTLSGAPAVAPAMSRADDVFDADAQEVTDLEEYYRDLRSDGYAIQGDRDLQDQVQAWCKVVEFAQDVVRRAGTSKDGLDLANRVLASIRTAFLQNTLYPSILESSTMDGTGIAILTYLEAIFSLMESNSNLSESILAFLSGHDSHSGTTQATSDTTGETGVMLGSQPMQARVSSSSIRYTLRDLLLAHMHPVSDKAQATIGVLPLRVLDLLLSKFDHFALELFDIIPDLTATKFPFDASASGPEEKDAKADAEGDNEESFQYPGAEDAGSEAESFVYPGAGGRKQAEAEIDELYRGPSELELLLRLVPSAERADMPQHARKVTSSTASFFDVAASGSTSHASYLKGAEATITSDVSFRRGIRIMAPYEADPNTRSSSEASLHDPMTPHRLFSGSMMLQHIISHLSTFFVNPPQLNLACTAVIAKLAACPYRSLDGWLLPATHPLRKLGQAGMLPLDFGALLNEDDLPPFAAAKQPFEIFQAAKPGQYASEDKGILLSEEAAILAVLERLMLFTARYKREIRYVEKHLKERRDGMLFVEDLAEAIGGEGTGTATNDGLPRPSMPRSGSATFGSRTHLSSTPTRPKKGSKNSLFGRYQPEQDDKAALSPYAAHYALTSEIRVQAYVLSATDTADAKGWKSPAMSEPLSDDTPDTPTRALPQKGGPIGQAVGQGSGKSGTRMVSLSMLLDNVIILEETVKELVALIVVRKSLGIDSV